MDGVLLQGTSLGNEILVKSVTGAVVSVSSVLIAWYARKIHQDWSNRAEKVDELYQAFFGMEDVSTMEGVVEVVETHENDIQRQGQRIDEIQEEIQQIKDKKEQINDKVKRLKKRVEERDR